MDIEFHYYMTYLIAARAGFSARDAEIIAHACQYVDDNDMILEIDKGKATYFSNYISQTMNILEPKAKLFRIYPLFHFLPGDPMSPTAWRKDGAMHWLTTTPDSPNARAMLDSAKASADLYRIGIACHTYADTWAHQNFVGYYSHINAMSGMLAAALPNIGHADAKHNPDWPALSWKDPRLTNERIDNRDRFMDAARALFLWLSSIARPDAKEDLLEDEATHLIRDLRECCLERDQTNAFRETRINRYRALPAQNPAYKEAPPIYNEDLWLEDAVNEEVRGLRDRDPHGGLAALLRVAIFTDHYTWKDSARYRETDWYRFQCAVMDHQEAVEAILTTKSHTLPGSMVGLTLDNY